MTCTLILTRHAKSSWETDAPSDHARPLNTRGVRSSIALGAWLRDSDFVPEHVLSSSSQRTRETYELMELGASASFIERLYHASSEVMFQVLREAESKRLMLLGHNPGIAAFAHAILHHAPAHSRFEDYPTGATLIAEFPIDNWSSLSWNSGRTVDFVVPRELLGE